MILLDCDSDPIKIAGPKVRSPVPIDGTAFTHEFHVKAAENLANVKPHRGRGAKLSALAVLARYWTGNPPTVRDASRFPHPFDGLSLWTRQGARIADLDRADGTKLDSSSDSNLDPVATLRLALDPDTYVLRQTFPSGRMIDRSVVLNSGWVTEVHIQRSNDDLIASGTPQEVGGHGIGSRPHATTRPPRRR